MNFEKVKNMFVSTLLCGSKMLNWAFITSTTSGELGFRNRKSSRDNLLSTDFGVRFYTKSKWRVVSSFRVAAHTCVFNSAMRPKNASGFKVHQNFTKHRKPTANHGNGVNFSCMVEIKGNCDFLCKIFFMMTYMTAVDNRKPKELLLSGTIIESFCEGDTTIGPPRNRIFFRLLAHKQ